MAARYRFDRFELLPGTRQLLMDGAPVALGARTFDFLLCLVEHGDRMVSKDELMALVWPDLVVTENNLSVQVSGLRKLLGAQALVTVSGRGYRFGLTVTNENYTAQQGASASRLALASQATQAPEASDAAEAVKATGENGIDRRHGAARRHVPDTAVHTLRGIDLSLPDKPSIAVLPFVNLSDDPQQAYFADGITEDITTELSRFRSLFVIARNSSFTYKGRAVDVRTVSKELGVRYVMEGSVRRSGSRVRVMAQLIDGSTGNHLWAEKYDRVLEDIFDVQEEVTQSIVGAIAPQIHATEQNIARRLRPGNLSAHDLAMRANANSNEAHRRNDRQLWQSALVEARQALVLDPDNVLALVVTAELQARNVSIPQFTDSDLRADWKEGMTAGTRAIDLDPTGSPAYTWMGLLQAVAGRYDEALASAQRGVELNPNDSNAWSNLSVVELWGGLPQQSLLHHQQAIRRSPRDPNFYLFNSCRALACFALKDHARGLSHALSSVHDAPNAVTAQMSLVLVAAGAGDVALALAAFEALRGLSPIYANRVLTTAPPFRLPDDRKRFTLAFRIAAGLEDPSAAAALR